MIGNQGDFVRIKYRAADFVEFGDGLRSSNVISQQKVGFGADQLSRLDFFAAGVSREDFFGHGHSHCVYIPPDILVSAGCPQTAVILFTALTNARALASTTSVLKPRPMNT